VGEKDSIPFLHASAWGAVITELTQAMRQKDSNPILEFATAIRNDYKSGSFTPVNHQLSTGEGIALIDHASEEEHRLLTEYFGSEAFAADPDYMKVVAWRNATVDTYNGIIRRIIYKDAHLCDIMNDERLVMDAPFSMNGKAILNNNEEIVVLSSRTGTKGVQWLDNTGPRLASFKVYYAIVQWEAEGRTKTATLPIIHEESKTDLSNTLSSLRDIALKADAAFRGKAWKQFFEVQDAFAWVKYNYAITGHSSQGSTYDNCLVLKWDIDYNKNIEERNRILYTACTRAKHTLFIEA